MYNRYVPQSDGSFRRSQMQEQPSNRPGGSPNPQRPNPPSPAPMPPQPSPPPEQGLGGFLAGLLPQSFDTEDIIIILLLLLLGGSGKDGHSSFLTLIIYLFL